MKKSELKELMRKRAETETLNKISVHHFFEAVDNGNFTRAKELLADDFTLQAPGLPHPLGPEEMLNAIKTHYKSFPDWTHTIEETIAEGNKVAVSLIQCGTHKGEYEGIPATGRKVVKPALHIIKIVNGKFKEWWTIEDNLCFMLQLNAELKQKKVE